LVAVKVKLEEVKVTEFEVAVPTLAHSVVRELNRLDDLDVTRVATLHPLFPSQSNLDNNTLLFRLLANE
jgi:hypothetical protein